MEQLVRSKEFAKCVNDGKGADERFLNIKRHYVHSKIFKYIKKRKTLCYFNFMLPLTLIKELEDKGLDVFDIIDSDKQLWLGVQINLY